MLPPSLPRRLELLRQRRGELAKRIEPDKGGGSGATRAGRPPEWSQGRSPRTPAR
jgi:hypothetical protein